VVLELSRKFGGWHDGGFKRCRGKVLAVQGDKKVKPNRQTVLLRRSRTESTGVYGF